ncbi:ATP-binding protein [Gracilimonas sp. Q87]|uniref:ATP-binding protein n=1 Tax=Gracilimonas sp. Q87 TaxID=3384766 RepID=UPI003984167B
MSLSFNKNPRLLLVGAFVILFMIVLSFYLYQGVLRSADDIIEDNKNITQTAVRKLTQQTTSDIEPVWNTYLAGINKITKQEERIVDSLLSVSVQQILSNFHRLEGGFYFYELDEFIGYSFPTIEDPKPAFGPPPRSYNIIREQARKTIQEDSLITQLHQFDPAIFPLSTQPIYINGELVAAAWARTHIERKLSTSQSIQSGTFFLTVGAILLGLFITVLIVWTLRTRIKDIKEGLSKMKYDSDYRLKEYRGAFGVISKAINEMTDTQQKEQERAKALQAELYQKDKMATLGNLIAGTAHEINTPISIIKTRVQIWERALRKSKDDNKNSSIITSQSLNIIHNEVDRVSSLIKRLLFFSKPLKNQKTYINMHELLSRNIERLSEAFPKYNLQIHTDFDTKIPKIFVDEEAIDHVVINILKNSIEASPKDCKIIITTKLLKDRNKIEIIVRDFGVGISNDIKPRIFEPFFSKKEHGTGLGLSICNEIVNAHDGRIEFINPITEEINQSSWDQANTIDISLGAITKITLPIN